MFRSATLAAAFVLVLGAGPGWAQPVPAIDAEGAAALRTAIAEGLRRTFPKVEGGSEFRWAGEPQVTPAGDRYDVALPALTIVDPEDTRFEVGTIRLTAAPRPDSAYAVAVTLPERMTMRDGDAPTAILSIGRQRFTGVWSAALENFLSADLAYGDLVLEGAKKEGVLRLGGLTGTQDLRADGPGTMGGPVAMALSELSFTDGEKSGMLKVGGMTFEADYSRVDLSRINQIKALAATHTAAGTEPPAMQILPLLGGLLGDASMRTRISGVSMSDGNTRLGLDVVSLSMGIRNLDRATSTSMLGLQIDGLKLDPLPGPETFMPKRFEIQLALDKLPNAALGQALLAMAALDENGAGEGPAHEAMGNAVTDAVLAAASQAGTELRIERLALDMPGAAAAADGSARVASEAARRAVGSFTVTLRGLDATAAALKPAPGTKPEPETQQALGVIAMLQAMGQQDKGAAGKDVRTYKIDLTEAGELLLNGADMGAMLGMGAQPAAPAKPQAGPRKS